MIPLDGESSCVVGGLVKLVHRLQPNHHSCAQFGLPKSVLAKEAEQLYNRLLEGVGRHGHAMLSTISLVEDGVDVHMLFESWQPLISILATSSGLIRKQRKDVWKDCRLGG